MADCRYKRSYYLIFLKKSHILLKGTYASLKKIKKFHSKRKKRHKRKLYFEQKLQREANNSSSYKTVKKYIFLMVFFVSFEKMVLKTNYFVKY